MKRSKLSKIIRESLKGIIKEQSGCNSYQTRSPGDFINPGPNDACGAKVTAIKCSDIGNNYNYSLTDLQTQTNGNNSQICLDHPGKCHSDPYDIKIIGGNFNFTTAGNCANGWTPVVGDHMLSHWGGGYTAWLVVSINGFHANCDGPRREWFQCNPGWTSGGCLEPGMPFYSSTHTADCNNDPIPNAAGPFGDTSCCGLFGCTDPAANNYDPNATTDDGSCAYDVYGCLGVTGGSGFCQTPSTNPAWYAGFAYSNGALNHDCAAGNTSYLSGTPCSDNVTIDDGSCVPITIGCGDPTAVNYYSGACVHNNNSCVYFGCNDNTAFNYDPQAAICDPSQYTGATDCCEYEGCADPIATNWVANATGCLTPNGVLDPNDTSCCDYTATRKCDKYAWQAHVWQNYSQLNGDPQWQVHFCEYCIDGTIPTGTDSWCKCCDPVNDPCEDFNNASPAMQQGCCDKCQMMGGTLPPNTQCHTLTNNCDCCETDTGEEIKGCLDPNAINANTCCPQVNFPGCIPTVQYDECCKYEDDPTGNDRGCVSPQDPTMVAINVGTCCPQSTYPGCVPAIHYEACCDYQEPGGTISGSGGFPLNLEPLEESFGTKHDTLQEIFKRRAGIIPNR